MKSIFKKIALVLAFAMVITMLPAKSASVAAADASANKWVRKTCTLYIDALEDDTIYVPAAYATAKTKVKVAKDAEDGWKTLGYSVSFASENENVAVVGEKYGLVEAVGIGQTTITATFTKKGAATVTESFPVTVKRAAASVALEEAAEKAVNSLVVGGTPVVLKAVMTDADGNQELVEKTTTPGKLSVLLAEGRKYVTDYLKFEVKNPEDKEVLKYDAEKNELTAVAEGTATLNVVAYRYDWKATAKTKTKYAKTRTAVQSYTVTVNAAGLVNAKQTAYNAFQITFDTAEEAKVAAEESKKYLNTASAAVTEKDDIIKLYKVLKDSDGKEIPSDTVIMSDFAADGNVVTATVFGELDEKSEYRVAYKNRKDITFETKEYIAEKLTVSVNEKDSIWDRNDTGLSEMHLTLRIFAKGAMGQDVDITGCKAYGSGIWMSTVTLEDKSDAKYSGKYSFVNDASNPVIYFYEQNVEVKVLAVFTDYFHNDRKISSDVTTFNPGQYKFTKGEILDWKIVDVADSNRNDWNGDWKNRKFAADDLEKRLVVKAKLYYGDKTPEEVISYANGLGRFSFETTNVDKLMIDKETGNLFPGKEPKDGIIIVRVYYDEVYIGSCEIQVYAKRAFTGFELSWKDGNNKLSYNSDVNADVNDYLTLVMKPVDQLGDMFKVDVTPAVQCISGNSEQYITIGPVQDTDKGYEYVVSAKPNGLPAGKSCTIGLKCTITYDEGRKTLPHTATLTMKNTNGVTPKSSQLFVSGDSDMKLEAGKNAAKDITVRAYSVDREGFKVWHLQLTPGYEQADIAKDQNTVVIRRGNEYVGTDNLENSGRDLTFKLTTKANNSIVVSGSAVTSTGAAVGLGSKDRNERCEYLSADKLSTLPLIQKIKTGDYQVSLYTSTNGSNPLHQATKLVQVKDSTAPIYTYWKKNSVSDAVGSVADVIGVIREAFDIKAADMIYVGYVSKDKDGNYEQNANGYRVVLSDDFVLEGDQLFVKQIRCLNSCLYGTDAAYYEVVTPINKSVVVGVIE